MGKGCSKFLRVLGYGRVGALLRPGASWVRRRQDRQSVKDVCNFYFLFSLMVPGTTRPRRLLTLWLLPENQRVIGFSFQLAIIQHQFALHALGYCHLCKDDKQALRFLLCTAAGEVVLIGSCCAGARARGFYLRRTTLVTAVHNYMFFLFLLFCC